jgi:hypothetical protein
MSIQAISAPANTVLTSRVQAMEPIANSRSQGSLNSDVHSAKQACQKRDDRDEINESKLELYFRIKLRNMSIAMIVAMANNESQRLKQVVPRNRIGANSKATPGGCFENSGCPSRRVD